MSTLPYCTINDSNSHRNWIIKTNYCDVYIYIYIHIYIILYLYIFFYLGFLSLTFTNLRTAGEGGGHFFISLLSLTPASLALRHYPGDYCRELTSTYSQPPDSNQEPLVYERKSLDTGSSELMFYKIGALKNFAKFTGKHLCQTPFFNKVADLILRNF